MFKGDGTNKSFIDVGTLASEVVRLIGTEMALRKIRVQIEAMLVPVVFGDRILLQQCLLNLLMNALDAPPMLRARSVW